MTKSISAQGFTLEKDQSELINQKLKRIDYADSLIVDLILRVKEDKKYYFDTTVNFRWGANAHVTSDDYDFAAGLNLSRIVIQAARDIMEGVPQTLDVGSFSGRHFSYVASFGAFTEASYATPQAAKNTLGHVAYLLEGVRELANLRPARLRLEADGRVLEGDYLYGAISNATSIGGILTMDPGQVDLNDGLFEVTLVHNPENLIDLSAIVHALSTRQYDETPLIDFFTTHALRITADADLPWTLDGEFEPGGPEIEVKNLYSAIRLVRRANK